MDTGHVSQTGTPSSPGPSYHALNNVHKRKMLTCRRNSGEPYKTLFQYALLMNNHSRIQMKYHSLKHVLNILHTIQIKYHTLKHDLNENPCPIHQHGTLLH